ncbi:MAG: HAD family hydrolase [Flexilinea sp.]
MINQLKSVLWDMDGTIIDSSELHYESWRKTFQEINVEITHEKFTETFGSNNHLCIASFLGYEPDELLFQKLSFLKESQFRKLAPFHAKPFPGVINWLKYFKEKHIKQAIASSAPLENITTVVKAFQLEQYFDVIVSGIDLPSKPAPDIFLKAAHLLNCEPKYCIVIEDSTLGLLSGRSAGMVTVGLVSTQPKETIDANIVLDNFLTPPEILHERILELI